tara:strand:- start:269 stop:553 length:285 start_codon:yes stop_codon:yes gene_type:complete
MKGWLTRKQVWRKTKSFQSDYNININNIDLFDNRTRNVSFKTTVSVILIPNCDEYKQNMMTSKMWYSSDDYFGFRDDYINELKEEENKKKYNTI